MMITKEEKKLIGKKEKCDKSVENGQSSLRENGEIRYREEYREDEGQKRGGEDFLKMVS